MGKAFILVTEGVRAVVSTHRPAHLVLMRPGVVSCGFAAFLGLELKCSRGPRLSPI